MALRDLLLERRAAIGRRWLAQTLATYPPQAAAFLAREEDRFANPVGHVLATGLNALLDALIEATGPDGDAAIGSERFQPALDEIVKIRAVQALSPGQAVAFLFLLKDAVRAELEDELDQGRRTDELLAVFAAIDRLALHGVDVLCRWRERAHDIRVREVKRRVSGLLRRVGWGADAPGLDPPAQPSCLP
ncbi:MAG: RsbRD N-terminal domain-containing protein [Deltaproteobacteria bacterium]|nr:RsbRD N-terminal domain-containing protein [Deltaproteobacteria bacterium]